MDANNFKLKGISAMPDGRRFCTFFGIIVEATSVQIFAVCDERKRDLLVEQTEDTVCGQSATCRFSFVVNRTENVCLRFFNKHQKTQHCIKKKV